MRLAAEDDEVRRVDGRRGLEAIVLVVVGLKERHHRTAVNEFRIRNPEGVR